MDCGWMAALGSSRYASCVWELPDADPIVATSRTSPCFCRRRSGIPWRHFADRRRRAGRCTGLDVLQGQPYEWHRLGAVSPRTSRRCWQAADLLPMPTGIVLLRAVERSWTHRMWRFGCSWPPMSIPQHRHDVRPFDARQSGGVWRAVSCRFCCWPSEMGLVAVGKLVSVDGSEGSRRTASKHKFGELMSGRARS